ncbi:O-antigen ABC exporter, ATP-binding protein [Luminiphilus syltensis NOR5-1B]|uniref:O-antigen ABC exporter, ATP-binding protein n=1 Tax=Luminiphilus syltensis NOR5-1B TaxID=565045 RepID=B8KWK7_9GAMM|nr:ATP-binding cassette domain-containing protein [Luminiphilus syltensis]EED34490.1 O-antigen ABC exporter, ATP-binding protein [Luminiphilus syltensis NOR5-1B]
MNDAVITIEDLGVRYARQSGADNWIIRQLSLTILKGETIGIIGRNGAGKSSLLRVLGRIILPDEGSVHTAPNLRAALLTLQLPFSTDLSCRDNIALNGMLLGMSTAQVKASTPQILDFAELGDMEFERVGTFSSGQRARLALGIAIASLPDVILIDEVLGVGDGVFRKKSEQAIAQLIRSNATVVLVSHNLNTISKLCHRVMWLENGTVKMIDTPEIVLPEYRRQIENKAS